MKLAMWQGLNPASIEAALDMLEATIISHPADVYVFPELFLGGYHLKGLHSRAALPSHLERVRHLSGTHSVAIVFGYIEPAPCGRAFYNSARCVDGGVVVADYRKTHLFGHAEKAAFLPGGALCAPFRLRGRATASLLICYDVEFPEAARALRLRGARLLLVPTANFAPYEVVNDAVVAARALENHCVVCYCNWGEFKSEDGVMFNGRSSVVGADGEVVAKFEKGEIGVKVAEIHVAEEDEAGEDDYLRDRRPELYW